MEVCRPEDLEVVLDLTNDYIKQFIVKIDAKNYEQNSDELVNLVITACSMLSSTLMDKLAGTFHIDRNEIVSRFIEKLKLTMKWVEYKNKIE